MADLRITRENARFQQWEALLTNRSKRYRAREFLVQGVRPITRAVEEGWTVRALLRAEDAALQRHPAARLGNAVGRGDAVS